MFRIFRITDGVTCAVFSALIVVAELKIEKSGTHVWQKDSPSERRVVASESRNFLIKRFYRQCSDIALIDHNPLCRIYCLSVSWEKYKV